jgi:hypothetical protein
MEKDGLYQIVGMTAVLEPLLLLSMTDHVLRCCCWKTVYFCSVHAPIVIAVHRVYFPTFDQYDFGLLIYS